MLLREAATIICPCSSRSSPRKEGGVLRKGDGSSFNDFQASVNDAWDCADDEFSVISGYLHYIENSVFYSFIFLNIEFGTGS